MLGQVFKVITD